ncbi:MAG: DUF3822 family protein [Luteibaculum sp.]
MDLWKTHLQVVTGLESKPKSNFSEFLKRRSHVSIVFFSHCAQLLAKSEEGDNWSDILRFSFLPDEISSGQKERLTSLLEAFNPEFNTCSIGVATQKSALIPRGLFQEELKNDYLVKNTGLNAQGIGLVRSNYLAELNSNIVFSVPAGLHNLLQSIGLPANYHHSLEALLPALLENPKSKSTLAINFCGSYFDLLVLDAGSVKFVNSFNAISSEDILYYILYVVEKLGKSIRDFNIELYGEFPDMLDKELLVNHLQQL